MHYKPPIRHDEDNDDVAPALIWELCVAGSSHDGAPGGFQATGAE